MRTVCHSWRASVANETLNVGVRAHGGHGSNVDNVNGRSTAQGLELTSASVEKSEGKKTASIQLKAIFSASALSHT